ncbi:Ig-like domain-containing protein [Novosphingobium kaempferiae]|uniref:Ig-like domain-containing protein n=1 Tax=Novosphingobium kaempferiae TaxID=2896849 RepID=UPI001E404B89|nr:Ig-like domain-containing protein [Novosphingobium kaempferiae]
MPVEAKIAPDSAGLRSAPIQTIDGGIPVPPGGSVALDIEPSAVSNFSREGSDLLVHLKSGEVVRIANFYLDPTRASHLLLVNDDQLMAVDLAQTASGGLAASSYVPMDAMAGFSGPAGTVAAGVTAGASGSALGAGTLIPLAAIGGGGLVVAAASGSSGGDNDSNSPPDTTAPTIATNLAVNTTGDRLTGGAEAGATVRVDANGDGAFDYSVTVAADGTFSVPLTPPLLNGETLSVIVRDTAGNVSPAATVTAPDTTPPAPASQLSIAPDGTGLSGIGEPGATVSVDVDGDGKPDYSVKISPDGTFTILFPAPVDNGQQIEVTITDPAGNSSPTATILAPDLTPPPATAPSVAPSNGMEFSGTAQAGVAVVLTDAAGNILGQAEIAADGTWSFTPQTPLADGTPVIVFAVNAEGQAGPTSTVIVDASAPPAPELLPSNGEALQGTAEAGATIILTDDEGTIIGQATVDGAGNWSFTPATPLPDGTIVSATAYDAAGNASPQATVTIDGNAPVAPTIAPTNGMTISGTAEAGTTVFLSDSGGNLIGQTSADENGVWSFSPTAPLPDLSTVIAVARDAAGNVSDQTSATVDASAPATPTIAPSDGGVLSGTAEAGSIVILIDGNGNAIGQVTASQNGNWIFAPPSPLPDGTIVNATSQDAAGNLSATASIVVDAVAPDAPVIQPTNGIVISGSAEAGAIVILSDGDDNPIGQAVANASGIWSFTPASPLTDGTVITATAQDAAGNASPATTAIVDMVAPATPVINASSGTTFSGSAEAGTTVILTDASGNPVGQVLVDASGQWSFTPVSSLPDGTTVSVVAQDAAGNTSPASSTVVDAIAPPIPTIDPSNGMVFTGTAEAGSLITLRDQSGAIIGQATTDGSGNWSFVPVNPLPDGSVVHVVAQDAAGNTSADVSTTIDATAPLAPTIAATNGVLITGTAEAGTLVTLSDDHGDLIGQTITDGMGNWSFSPATPLADGSIVQATAQDAAGNVSSPVSTAVDATAPSAPTIDPSNGTELNGTAEAGSLLLLTDGNGNVIGQVTTDAFGFWTFTPSAPLADGTVVNATAQDAAGNISSPATTTVDSSPPIAPTIDPTNGWEVTGTGEPGATVVLMDGTGNTLASFSLAESGSGRIAVYSVNATAPDLGPPIGEVSVDTNGNWVFIPLLPLPDGTVVIAISIDAAGNVGGPVSTVVDGVPPSIPTIDPTSGLLLEGTADAGVLLRLTDEFGNMIGQTVANGEGNWSFTPSVLLPNGTTVNVVAIDEVGNESLPATTLVDSIAPATPVIGASDGTVIFGTAEAGSLVTLTDSLGLVIGQTITNPDGTWTFTPVLPLPNATIINAVAQDEAGNTSLTASTAIDSLPPTSPFLTLLANGELLIGTAEPNSQVRIIIDGDTANAITVTVDGSGGFNLPLTAPLIAGQTVEAIAIDAAGNQSAPALLIAPDYAPPAFTVVEVADGWLNADEAANGIEVEISLRPTMQVGQIVTVTLNGQGGYQVQVSHELTSADVTAGIVLLNISPAGGIASLPQGPANITTSIDGGASSAPDSFDIDTIPPSTPVLSLLASILDISADPGTQLTISVDIGGTVASTVVVVDGAGLASLNLLTGLDIQLDWAQLLGAQVTVSGQDEAGNVSDVASLAVAPNIEPPVAIGNFGLAVSLNPFSPQFGVTGTTEPDSIVVIRVVTPALNVELLPIIADNSGHFTLNLLSPAILSQLGLNITDILNLGSQISLGFVATDPQGHESAFYGLALSPAGLSLNIGQIDVNGTLADDIMSGSTGAEHINGNSGNDLILNVATGDHVLAGPGNDTIEITAANFSIIDGGSGFDTLWLANGMDLDYGPGAGTLANIERIDLGSGDNGSTLTLTASEIDAITDAGNTLQVTGEGNDVLRIVGAIDTGTTETHDGLVFDVYTFGATTVLVEDNTVQVVV